jgi:hypothetical protein
MSAEMPDGPPAAQLRAMCRGSARGAVGKLSPRDAERMLILEIDRQQLVVARLPQDCCSAIDCMFRIASAGEMSFASAEATISLQLMFRSSPCLSSRMPQPQLAHMIAPFILFRRSSFWMDRGGGIARVLGRVGAARMIDRSPPVGRALIDDFRPLERMARSVPIPPILRLIVHGQIVSPGPTEPRHPPVSAPRASIISLKRLRSAEI